MKQILVIMVLSSKKKSNHVEWMAKDFSRIKQIRMCNKKFYWSDVIF